jgi:hypothetical protein
MALGLSSARVQRPTFALALPQKDQPPTRTIAPTLERFDRANGPPQL